MNNTGPKRDRGGRKDPAFLFYATTWLQSAEVNSMSLEQQGAYVRLLCFAWLHGSIPADREEIRGLIGMASASDEAFERVWSSRLCQRWVAMPGTPGRLINERQEHERRERMAKAEDMRRRGQAGGEQSAKQRATGEPSRTQAGGQAGAKPSTSTSTTPDTQTDRELSVPGSGVPEPSYHDERRASGVAALVAGAAAERRARA